MPVWVEREVAAEAVDALKAAGHPPLVARLLALRGIAPEDAEAYFEPAMRHLKPYAELPGAVEAAEVILRHVREKKRIVVFGDYDCDGVCATAIMVRTLEALGAAVGSLVPDRLREGYGLTAASMERLLAEWPDVALVVTVDNGINSVAETAALTARGISVVVTDHHLPGAELPACPVVNPKVAAPEAFAGLCGAGVAFLVAYALIDRAKREGLYTGEGKLAGTLIVLAGLATVTDIMPLRGQNRLLVVFALQHFRKYAPVGLRELLDRASRTAAPVLVARDFGYTIGPRVNAAGRVGDVRDALQLVLTADREEAREFARRVDLDNSNRKAIEQKMSDEAARQIVPGAAAQVIDLGEAGETVHPGVAGIVAARMLERLAAESAPVPVCVVVGGHGSARAPEGYNVRDAFEACQGELSRFGGHAAAGGFSVLPGRIGAFRAAFAEVCARQAAEGACATHAYVDAWVAGKDLTLEMVEGVLRMAPFGEGNPEPVFGIRAVRLDEVNLFGSEGRHLQIKVHGGCPRAVWWGHGSRVEELRRDSNRLYDLFFTVEISTYGTPHVELRLADMRESEGEASR